MIPVFVRKETLDLVEKNINVIENFLQKINDKKLNRVEMELLINDFRVVMSMSQTTEVLEAVVASIENIDKMVNESITLLKGQYDVSFIGFYDSIINKLKNGIINQIALYLGNPLNEDIENASIDFISDNSLEKLIENDIRNLPVVNLNINGKITEQLVFYPLQDLTKEKYLFVMLPDTGYIMFLIMLTELLIKSLTDENKIKYYKKSYNILNKDNNEKNRILKDYFKLYLKEKIKESI